MRVSLWIGFTIAPLLAMAAALESQNPAATVSKTQLEESFYVAGWLVRTNNADEAAGRGKIGDLWQRLYKENLGAQIPDRADAALTVVYSDYAGDEKGDYNYLLGARVTSIAHLPAGMTYRKVESGRYAVLTTGIGAMPGVLQDAWRRIWVMPPAELGGRRAFRTDYEIYDKRSANPQQAQIEIHIGLKAEEH
jgi:predicted transcriptional regulator YdeE